MTFSQRASERPPLSSPAREPGRCLCGLARKPESTRASGAVRSHRFGKHGGWLLVLSLPGPFPLSPIPRSRLLRIESHAHFKHQDGGLRARSQARRVTRELPCWASGGSLRMLRGPRVASASETPARGNNSSEMETWWQQSTFPGPQASVWPERHRNDTAVRVHSRESPQGLHGLR